MAERTFRAGQWERAEAEGVPGAAHTGGRTVYDDIEELLRLRGWCRGRPSGRSGALDLGTAVDVAVGIPVATAGGAAPGASSRGRLDPRGGETGARLARAGRIRRHLRDLARAASLTAWNDSADWASVADLLASARVAHPDD